jgi:hypothetical protein
LGGEHGDLQQRVHQPEIIRPKLPLLNGPKVGVRKQGQPELGRRRPIRHNFLERGRTEKLPVSPQSRIIIPSLKALRGQVFRIESLLPAYGALYDKLPIHAYVWKEDHGDLPVDVVQLWDCMGYRFTIIEKIGLRNLGVKFLGKDKQWHFGRYLFTVDFCADELTLDTGFTEQAEEHKSFNWIQLDNGQFACQPNNRCLWYDQSLIPAETKFPDFQAAKEFWTVDGTRKWSAGDDWFYTIEEKT